MEQFSVLDCRVYQLALLEYDQRSANGTPQGVILALVGAEPPEGGTEKESKEAHKVVRMYNLASLASITSWATTGKVSSVSIQIGWAVLNGIFRTTSR